MNHASLFSGIGGFDLAAEWAGWNNVFHCEINPFGQKVLKYYWPNAESYGDITKTDFTIWRNRIDVLTGGFPCQPYSLAGKRKGKEDERHLWPEMLRAIREIAPKYIVGENVYGLVNWNGGLVFNEVQTDLESEGYEVQPVILPACSKNAPHKRERVWFIAYRANTRIEILRPERENTIFTNSTIAYSGSKRCNNGSDNRKERYIQSDKRIAEENKSERNGRECRTCETGSINTDPNNKGLQRSENQGSIEESRAERNKQPTRFFQPTWNEFPTQSPVCIGNDGISSRLDGITFPKWRNESIKAYGNAIVPQVVYEIFKAINQYENL